MSLTLRLRLPTGPSNITIAPESTQDELLEQIATAAGAADASALTVSYGFPPKPLALEQGSTIGVVLHPMELLTVQVAAPAAPTTKAKAKGGRPPSAAAAGKGRGATLSSPAAAAPSGVHTLSNLSGSASGSASRKRPAATGGGSGGGGGGGGGGKRKATGGALRLGSEEGIGSSLLGAVSKKGGGVHHREDPAQSFLKAAAQSALAHHVEEVHANERFQAALGISHGSCEFVESDDGRRLDGMATQCEVKFKVGRATRKLRCARRHPLHPGQERIVFQRVIQRVILFNVSSSPPCRSCRFVAAPPVPVPNLRDARCLLYSPITPFSAPCAFPPCDPHGRCRKL